MQCIVAPYPHKKDNDKLFKVIEKNITNNLERGNSSRTHWDLHKKGIKEIDKLMLWISDHFDRATNELVIPYHRDAHYDFKIHSCWGMSYNKGEGVSLHNHFPYALSFVYYVRMPKGAAPLTISETEISPKEGEIVIFPSILSHGVNDNQIKGRCCLAGNILFLDTESSPGG